ncbi:GNAT family N-acetyltransferase [Flavobacteriaceae bacterium]|nr:GNAT family N-acetyltransferase [Flavobacteriaceae bacterium]
MESLKFDIREAALEDLPKLKEFEQSLIAFERPFATNLKKGAITYYDINDLIVRKDALFLVAEIEGVLVGSGYGLLKNAVPYKIPAQFNYLGFMYVVPSYRGKGIIGDIIERLIKWSNEKNIYEIQLDVYAENAWAIRAYEKKGFKPDLLKMRL